MSQAKAGSFEGTFKVRRPMSGRETWKRGDTREDRVSDVAHLIRDGALTPADKATADAASEFLGVEIKVGDVADRDAFAADRPITSLSNSVVLAASGPLANGADAGDAEPATMKQTRTQLADIAAREGVAVETDDNKADLVRKITEKRAAAVVTNKAESDRSVLNKAEADNASNKS